MVVGIVVIQDKYLTMEEELREEEKVSKEQKSRNMNIANDQHQKELNIKNVSSQLSAVTQKNEQRKVSEVQIEYLMSQFAMSRNKAVNLLRKMDLKQVVRVLVFS